MIRINTLIGFENVKDEYFVTTCGKILSTIKGVKIIVPKKDKDGYIQGTLMCKEKGKRKQYKAHRIVALAYIDNPYNKPQVNHNNEIKDDNYVQNLSWMTQKENNNYGTRNKRANDTKSNSIYKLDYDLNIIDEYKNLPNASSDGYTLSLVGQCCNRDLKTYKGFIWVWKRNYEEFKLSYDKKEYLKRKNSKEIIQYDKDMNIVNKYNSFKEVNENGFGRDYVKKCCDDKKDMYKGYIWKYK